LDTNHILDNWICNGNTDRNTKKHEQIHLAMFQLGFQKGRVLVLKKGTLACCWIFKKGMFLGTLYNQIKYTIKYWLIIYTSGFALVSMKSPNFCQKAKFQSPCQSFQVRIFFTNNHTFSSIFTCSWNVTHTGFDVQYFIPNSLIASF
jgi:hypothetical protein